MNKDNQKAVVSYCTAVKETLAAEKLDKGCCKKAYAVGLSLGNASLFDADGSERVSLVCPQCAASFFRGVFVAAGSVNAPDKSHHLELRVTDEETAEMLAARLIECALPAKVSSRRGKPIVYFKDGETIFGFLSFIGAKKTAFDFFDVLLERQVRNDIHRKVNFETANLKKAAAATAEQLDAIRYLYGNGFFDELSDKLRETAQFKLDNPDATLSELAALHEPPITKSCVNHRLGKLIEAAKAAGHIPQNES